MTDSPASSSGSLRPLRQEDLELILAWRNHDDVRQYMYNRHLISAAEHSRWFAQCQSQPGRHLLLYEEAGQPQGFVNFAPTRFAGVVEWGFYAAVGAAAGTGRRLGQAAMNHAFLQLGLHKVCAEALDSNARSLRLHEALGFQREGLLREHYHDGSRYHSIICLGLLSQDWAGHH
ncbi:MAG TPA: UDP-4-amino-4,6-dideoxy-N-acetyl-beta-L-altrosamine N-acetyltransferase [Moraxellaceae bacterium]